ncbi:class I fructose-bisphosphate aldolase [Candidatus Hodarchaeum mangrovi]
MIGKKIRLNRLFDKSSKKIVIVPMDHGAYMGPINGIENIEKTIIAAHEGGADAILINPGIMRFIPTNLLGELSIILRITNTNVKSEIFPYEPVISSVSNVIKLGIDAIAFTVNIGGLYDLEGISEFGKVNEECQEYGIPLLGEFLPAGAKMVDPYSSENVKFVARIASELGADLIKTNYTGSPETFREVTSTALVPVVIAGGETMGTDKDVMLTIEGAMKGGGAGICIGRNLWQRKNPRKMIEAACKIVHEGASVNEIIDKL